MKKTLILIFSISFFISGYAQYSKLSIGAEIGPSLASMRAYPDDFLKYEPKFGFSSGITIDYSLSSHSSLKSGLFYETKGQESEITYTDQFGQTKEKGVYKFNFDYISLPVQISFSTNSDIKLCFSGGIFLGYLISQKNIIKGMNSSYSDTNYADHFKRLDLGLVLGFGLIVPVSERITIDYELKDNLGLRYIGKYVNGTIKTNSIVFSMGIKYRI